MATSLLTFPPTQDRPWIKIFTLFDHPIRIAILAFFVYAVFAQISGGLFRPSKHSYFNYQADAFLHNQIHLRLTPPSTHDLIHFDGKLYLYWSPFSAILLMPFIAIFGVNFSDVFFTVVVGAVNSGLVAAILREGNRRGIFHLTPLKRGILAVFFAFGTVHMTLAPLASVWFTGQVVGFFCVAAAYYSVLRFNGLSAFLLAGIALAGALLTRNALVFAGIWPAYFLIYQHRTFGWKKIVFFSLAGAVPILVAGSILIGLNIYRFGSPTDFGLNYHQMHPLFVEEFNKYGVFNLHYVPINLYYQYVFYPLPLRGNSAMGGSLFLLSPVFFYVFKGIFQGKSHWSVFALLFSILTVNVPILLVMGTGWIQFGPRYTLDFTVPLLLITAMGVEKSKPQVLLLLTCIAIVSYTGGVAYLSY